MKTYHTYIYIYIYIYIVTILYIVHAVDMIDESKPGVSSILNALN
jgi:hypothetical protein